MLARLKWISKVFKTEVVSIVLFQEAGKFEQNRYISYLHFVFAEGVSGPEIKQVDLGLFEPQQKAEKPIVKRHNLWMKKYVQRPLDLEIQLHALPQAWF